MPLKAGPLAAAALLGALLLAGACARSVDPALGLDAAPSVAAEPTGCFVTLRASVPTDFAGGVPRSIALVNGRPVEMVVDTGYTGSVLLPPSVAAELGVVVAGPVEPLRMLDGVVGVRPGRVASLRLGGLTLANVQASVTSADTYPGIDPEPAIGVRLLSEFDVVIDPFASRIGFYEVARCVKRVRPFGSDAVTLPMLRDPRGAWLVPIAVDGQPLLALLDTGAGATWMSREGVRAAGVDPTALARSPRISFDDPDAPGVECRAHCFEELWIGDLKAQDVTLVVVDTPSPYDIAVGMDVLGARRSWLSFATATLHLDRRVRDRQRP